jgi:hypothetical protein
VAACAGALHILQHTCDNPLSVLHARKFENGGVASIFVSTAFVRVLPVSTHALYTGADHHKQGIKWPRVSQSKTRPGYHRDPL